MNIEEEKGGSAKTRLGGLWRGGGFAAGRVKKKLEGIRWVAGEKKKWVEVPMACVLEGRGVTGRRNGNLLGWSRGTEVRQEENGKLT